MTAAYGVEVLSAPYDLYVRLWCNLPRVMLRRAAAFALGLGYGRGKPSRGWAEALASCEGEAREVWLRMREQASAARHRGAGGGEWEELTPTS
jgi:hypothetical protein